jgi:hypothetical protein
MRTCDEGPVLGASQRSRARRLVEQLRSLHEAEESLHLHDSGNWQPLHPMLRGWHDRAKDASHLADHVAKNWPEEQKRYLHGKAAQEHTNTAKKLHSAGFTHLARQHLQWAHYHASHAVQHGPQAAGLQHHAPTGGHARSGHTLPSQPPSAQHYGDVPSARPSAGKAKETKTHWNDRAGEYQEIPASTKKLVRRANTVSKSVNRISYDPSFSDEERAHHHRVAASHHVQAAQELMRHGFHRRADQHMQLAQGHTDRAGEHDAKPRALLPAPKEAT